jgi:hypothetical protein
MKNLLLIFLILFVLLNSSCKRGLFNELFGEDIYYNMPSNSKFILKANDTLVFNYEEIIEKYVISNLTNGLYFESITGTCGKNPFDIFEFQAIYIKPVDSIDSYILISDTLDDCWGKPSFKDDYICIIKNLVDTYSSDKIKYNSSISWLNEFSGLESEYSDFLKSVTLNNKTFKDIYIYSYDRNGRIDKLYYSKKYGFVGYLLTNGKLFNLKNEI